MRFFCSCCGKKNNKVGIAAAEIPAPSVLEKPRASFDATPDTEIKTSSTKKPPLLKRRSSSLSSTSSPGKGELAKLIKKYTNKELAGLSEMYSNPRGILCIEAYDTLLEVLQLPESIFDKNQEGFTAFFAAAIGYSNYCIALVIETIAKLCEIKCDITNIQQQTNPAYSEYLLWCKTADGTIAQEKMREWNSHEKYKLILFDLFTKARLRSVKIAASSTCRIDSLHTDTTIPAESVVVSSSAADSLVTASLVYDPTVTAATTVAGVDSSRHSLSELAALPHVPVTPVTPKRPAVPRINILQDEKDASSKAESGTAGMLRSGSLSTVKTPSVSADVDAAADEAIRKAVYGNLTGDSTDDLHIP